jgi:hypothetical protein
MIGRLCKTFEYCQYIVIVFIYKWCLNVQLRRKSTQEGQFSIGKKFPTLLLVDKDMNVTRNCWIEEKCISVYLVMNCLIYTWLRLYYFLCAMTVPAVINYSCLMLYELIDLKSMAQIHYCVKLWLSFTVRDPGRWKCW